MTTDSISVLKSACVPTAASAKPAAVVLPAMTMGVTLPYGTKAMYEYEPERPKTITSAKEPSDARVIICALLGTALQVDRAPAVVNVYKLNVSVVMPQSGYDATHCCDKPAGLLRPAPHAIWTVALGQ